MSNLGRICKLSISIVIDTFGTIDNIIKYVYMLGTIRVGRYHTRYFLCLDIIKTDGYQNIVSYLKLTMYLPI